MKSRVGQPASHVCAVTGNLSHSSCSQQPFPPSLLSLPSQARMGNKLCSELKENPGKLVAWQVFWWRINRAASLRASTENPSLKIIRSISKIERNVLCEWYVWGFRLFGLPEHKSEVFPRRVSHSSVPNAPLGFCLLEALSAEILKGIRWRFISAWTLRRAWHSGKGGCARLCAKWVWVVKLGCKN